MLGVGRRLRHLCASRRRWARDVRANMQIVEVMVVGLMVVGAVVAVSTMDVPVSRTEGFKETNENLVNDALSSMARHPSDDVNRALFGSILEEYVMEAIAGNRAPLMAYLNKTLPAGANYNVLLDNGYGPPRPLVESGSPPGEAVAGSIQFVPKLAYTFMISDFSQYQGDFQMNVHSLPISNGALLHDEGDSVELAVTFHDTETGDPVTVRTYGSTALRMNDPNARSWPSVAMYNDVDEKNHFIDASGESPIGLELPLIGDVLIDAFNVSFSLALEETAGIQVPKDTQIRFQFPRLWDLRGGQREYVESSPDLGNAKFWKDFEYEGNSTTGLVVTARLKEAFSGEKIWFNMTADYMALIDSAHPHFGTISVSLGHGVQGMSNLVVKLPGANLLGSLRREPYLSLTKPLISGDTTTWGMAFANKGQTGDQVKIDSIEIRQPQGKAIFKNVQLIDSWQNDTWEWSEIGPGHWKFAPKAGTPKLSLSNGDAAWVSFKVDGGNTKDNNYRNENYLNVTPRFNPEFTTSGANGLGEWEFTQRAFEMWEEWIYRTPVAPSDGDPLSGYIPGWPDQEGYEYWVRGGTTYRDAVVPANFTYSVTPFAASSGYAGDYQGSHVFSSLDLVDATSTPTRDFALGEKVRIKNNFTALFGELSAINGLSGLSVSDLRIDTYVYTPEKAWKGLPSRSFSADASILTVLEDIRFLESATVAEDDLHLLIAVDTGGLVYGLDATDGTKYWVHDTATNAESVAVVDLDGDGADEVIIGHEGGKVTSLDVRPTPALESGREQWTRDLSSSEILIPPVVGAYDILDVVQIATADPDRPELAVISAPDLNDAWVYGLDVDFDGSDWTTAVHSSFRAEDTERSQDLRMQDLEPVWIDTPASGDPGHVAVASDNRTVMLLDATDLSTVTWITDLAEKPYRLSRGDVDQDGADDMVVNTYDDAVGGSTGKGVLVISGRTGNWGPDARPTAFTNAIDPFDVIATSDGGVFGTANGMYVLQDATALYEVNLAWPNLDVLEGPLDLGNIQPLDWNGVDATPDGRVFVIEDEGEIRATTDKRLDNTYDWERVTPVAPSEDATFIDLHVAPDWETGGRIHGLASDGTIHKMEDKTSYTELASVCGAGVDCVPTPTVERWRVEEDGAGNAVAFFALVYDAEASPPTSEVYRYDVAGGTWSTVHTWSASQIKDLHIGADGTYHVAGRNTTTGAPWLERKAPAGAWTPQTLMSPSGTLTSVLVSSAGEAYASSNGGVVWRQSATDTWTRVPISGMPASDTALVETADGQVWVIGEDFTAAPLYTHQASSWAYFPAMHDEIPDGESITHMELKVTEGHTGGDQTSLTHRTLTALTWWYKTASVSEWTEIPIDDSIRNPFVDKVTYTVPLACPDADACEDIQLRAELRNRVLTDGLDTMRRDGSASPMIRDIQVRLLNAGIPGSTEVLEPDADVLLPESTAIFTEAHQGFVTPLDPHRAWTYVGSTNAVSPNLGENVRKVAVTSQDVTNGTAGVDVMITENDPTSVGYLLDGLTGGIKRPASGTTSWVTTATDLTDQLLVLDIDGDGTEEIVGAGLYDGVYGAVRVWDIEDDTVTTSAGDGGALVRDLVSLGIWNGKHQIAYTTTEDLITALSGDPTGGAPARLWTNDPSVTQGKATFIYDIDPSDMYGTGIVVSELVFGVNDNGNELTQTARLLDWFNITPPNESVPNPPIYTVEIVSWFNEV